MVDGEWLMGNGLPCIVRRLTDEAGLMVNGKWSMVDGQWGNGHRDQETMSRMEKTITGKVYVVGDNIDTDQIIPAQYLNFVPTIPEEYEQLGSYALSGLPDDCPRFVDKGSRKSKYSIVIAGQNFGCGSSREHAPISLGAAGVRAVVAESFARIFFRNVVATGVLYPVETAQPLRHAFHTGDDAELDINAHCITNRTTGEKFPLKDIGEVAPVIAAGGIFEYARAIGMISQKGA